MSLIPFLYDSRPFGMVERDLIRPDFYQTLDLVPQEVMRPWDTIYRPWQNMIRQMEQLSSGINQLALKEASQLSSDGEKFQVNVDVQHFAPNEISVKVVDGFVTVEGKHEEKRDEHGYISRQFVRRYALPQGCLPDVVESKLSSDGVLTITAPKVLPLPSTGEKIIAIIKTGPIKKQISHSESMKE
ncbi:protein lethal(2)essential for life-like [Nymphalis io]|uniref:protein lethal(2)essential for life-like n=1 Tax=Inachis io TaxID=171585 RepID=UPI00216A7765|nr:protein lethal(2)essential for life-like [Nymphalis io]